MYDNGILAFAFDFPPEDQVELVRNLPLLFRGRSALEAALIHQSYINNQPDIVVAKVSGLPVETVAQVREQIRSDAQTIRDLRQPPHAAD